MKTRHGMISIACVALLGGCTPHVAIEGGDKPIKVEVTLKVDQQLDQFFAFQNKYDQPSTQTATQPATQPSGTPSSNQ
jgi:hypothetical protein